MKQIKKIKKINRQTNNQTNNETNKQTNCYISCRYGGAHKQRFNSDGTGKGKVGRVSVSKYKLQKTIA